MSWSRRRHRLRIGSGGLDDHSDQKPLQDRWRRRTIGARSPHRTQYGCGWRHSRRCQVRRHLDLRRGPIRRLCGGEGAGNMAKRPKAPKGCYWRDGTLWGRIQTGGRDNRWSLRTDDPKVARQRRQIERERVIASHHYGDHRRTLSEAVEAWGKFVANEISKKTLTRYLCSLAVLQPHLEGTLSGRDRQEADRFDR